MMLLLEVFLSQLNFIRRQFDIVKVPPLPLFPKTFYARNPLQSVPLYELLNGVEFLLSEYNTFL